LVVVGGAHHTTSDHDLAREVAALGLSNRVRMLGSVPQEDLRPIYHLADLLLLASLNEGFGLVLLEAMACGLPVVAARTGSVQEVVGEAATLVDGPRDEAAFAGAIRDLLANQMMRADMRQRGLDRSRLFSWESTGVKTLALYDEIGCGEQAVSPGKPVY
jgi:glycosyltransferase involved in cell wall biosynthesis